MNWNEATEIEDVIHAMDECTGYLEAALLALYLLQLHHGWKVTDWEIEFDDISSDYRLLRDKVISLRLVN